MVNIAKALKNKDIDSTKFFVDFFFITLFLCGSAATLTFTLMVASAPNHYIAGLLASAAFFFFGFCGFVNILTEALTAKPSKESV
jgi:hypothetical protein